MFAPSATPRPSARPVRPLMIAGLILVVQVLVIGLTYKHGIDFYCLDYWPALACSSASRTRPVFTVPWRRWRCLRCCAAGCSDLLAQAGTAPRALGLNAAGFALAFAPIAFLSETAQARAMVLPAFAFWTLGMGLMLAGLGRYLAPPARWGAFLRAGGPALAVTVVAGALTPVLAMQLQPIWQLDRVADLTFGAVTWLVDLLGYDVTADPVRKLIGTDAFRISVAPVCSGIEGIALVTLFVTLYLWPFRREVRFPHALILYPLGIAASAALNVVRIAALLILGIEGQPDLAIGGFHSHAGWIMFTAVALGVIALARSLPWLRRDADTPAQVRTAPLPLRADPQAARILPFAIFMLTAVVVPAITHTPALFYPLRVVLVAAVLALFWPILRALVWRIAPVAVAGGVIMGAIWIAIPVPPGAAPYGDLTGGALLAWYVFRGLGTVLIVPLVEELFFRDYLERRLRGDDRPAPWRALGAALVTAALFAALHDRWAEAFAAGLVFSWLAHRANGRIADAIVAHGVANLVVFAGAVATGNLAMI